MRLLGHTILALMLGISLEVYLSGAKVVGSNYRFSTSPEHAFRRTAQEKVSRIAESPSAGKLGEAELREAVMNQFTEDLSHMRWTWNGELERDNRPESGETPVTP